MPCRVKQSGLIVVSILFRSAWASIEGYRTLEDLEILQISVFGIDVELDPCHRNIEVDTIKDLAESSTVLGSVSI